MPYDDSIPDSTLLMVHPELKPIFDKHGAPKIGIPTRDSISRFRKGFTAANMRFNKSQLARNALGCSDPEDASQRYWSEIDHSVPVRDGTTIPIRIYKPNSLPASGVPVVVMMHGGGWVMGDLSTEATLSRLFTTKLGVLVINVAFRLYPDVPFPTPIHDCYDTVKWAATHSRSFGGNPALGFILAGVSGGGTYASISAHLARNDNLTPRITGQWLTCPVIGTQTDDRSPGTTTTTNDQTGHQQHHLYDPYTKNRSTTQNANAPLMSQAFADAIMTMAEYKHTPLLTPLLFKDHRNLGSGGVYVQVTGLDPWRDGGRIYQGLCARAGNRTKLQVYSGLPHCWWNAFPGLKVTEEWLGESVEGLLWLLMGDGEEENGKGKAKL